VLLAGLFCFISGFSQALLAAEPRIEISSYNQFTTEDEIRIGTVLSRDFESREELIGNSLLLSYVRDVTNRLGKASRRPELTYTCNIVNSTDVNAFSFPGGAIYVTTGLLNFVRDESELAAVIGHEIGHIAARHLMDRLALEVKTKAAWDKARAILPVLDDKQLQQGMRKLGLPLVPLILKQYDRGNETDADVLAVYNLPRANWNPLGEIRVLERLQEGEQKTLAAAMVASHPNPSDRSRRVSEEIKTIALSSSLEDNSLSFRAMKLAIGLLPKPKSEHLTR
jgi:predicted Zn-dependent protease